MHVVRVSGKSSVKGLPMRGKSSEKLCLGIESTADDFGIGICTFDGRFLANVSDSFVPSEGGIHPRQAAQHHAEVAGQVLEKALQNAKASSQELSLIAFSQGPGLGPCLRTGATVARALSSYLGLPLVGVNHCVAHVEIGRHMTNAENPVTLYASGGNTLVTAYDSGRYRIFGETLDIALGNCLDVFAREAGLRQQERLPFGAVIEQKALMGKCLIDLPYTVKGMDISLSGLLTAAVSLLKLSHHRMEDICYSLQETAFSMVTEVTERALAHTEKREVLLTGGVAANKRLQTMLQSISAEHNARFDVVPLEFAVDNGAMIAWTGVLAFKHRIVTAVDQSFVRLRWRLEEVDVPWVKHQSRS